MTRLSYARGADEPPVPDGTIGDWLDRAAELYPDVDGLVAPWQGVRWTWLELRERTDAFARGLSRLGLAVGDRVGILSPELRRVGADPARHRAPRSGAGLDQSRLPDP